MDYRSKIILIAGPTASGKSKIAIQLAKRIKGEIINADSMQVYKEFKILTARPIKKDEKQVKHHLYGFYSVKKNFSTGKWLKNCISTIKKIKKKRKIPIIVGGTGLYFKALIDGLVKIPKIPIRLRNLIIKDQKKLGQKNFYKKLVKLDGLAGKNLSSKDVQRSIRAFEVKKYTKISLFKWFKQTRKNFEDKDFYKIYVDIPKDILSERIKRRIEKMLKAGAFNEVDKFLKMKIKKNNNSNKIIGVREIQNYLQSENKDINYLKELLLIKTRQYAKRQKTWSKKFMHDWRKVDYRNFNFSKKF
tara:strand:+ start:40 stop:948 length:909 start_codon:yes stop_codon:yes gene_type:complete